MKNLKEQVMELEKDQTHMLEAIKYLNDRLEAMEKKESNLKDFLESQGTIDEIIVKNCDDIHIMKRTKENNEKSIKNIEAKIETIDQEIEKRTANLETQLQPVTIGVRDIENVIKSIDERDKERPCTYFNKGFCKKNESCPVGHQSMKICENYFH